VPEEQLCVLAHLSQRYDDVAGLERPGRCLREQGRVQHEVVGVDDSRAPPPE